MLHPEQLQELQNAYHADEFYLTLSSAQARDVLHEIIAHPHFPGSSDPPLLALIGTFLRITQPQRMLQLGTHVGFSTVYFADILAQNSRPGQLITVDPDEYAGQYAQQWVDKAGLTSTVTFVRGYSTEPKVHERLQGFGKFDLIYLDSSHAYATTLEELNLIFGSQGWLHAGGSLLLHDAGEHASQFDPTQAGGVRRAMDEWLAAQNGQYHHLILEPPLWPNACGVGLIARRRPEAGNAQVVLSQSVNDVATRQLAEKEQQIVDLEERIRHLEDRIRRLESGRVMRLLNWVQRRVR